MSRPKICRKICSDETVLPFTECFLESKYLLFLLISSRMDRKDKARKLSEYS